MLVCAFKIGLVELLKRPMSASIAALLVSSERYDAILKAALMESLLVLRSPLVADNP